MSADSEMSEGPVVLNEISRAWNERLKPNTCDGFMVTVAPSMLCAVFQEAVGTKL